MNKQIKREIIFCSFAITLGFFLFTLPTKAEATENGVIAEVVNQEAVIDGEQTEICTSEENIELLKSQQEIIELQQQICTLEKENQNLILQNNILQEENSELKKF